MKQGTVDSCTDVHNFSPLSKEMAFTLLIFISLGIEGVFV